jgi:hypothetical protein
MAIAMSHCSDKKGTDYFFVRMHFEAELGQQIFIREWPRLCWEKGYA